MKVDVGKAQKVVIVKKLKSKSGKHYIVSTTTLRYTPNYIMPDVTSSYSRELIK